MDFGLGSVLDRFEKAFGKRITNLLLGLVGLATALTCVSVIWDNLLQPGLRWILQGVDAITEVGFIQVLVEIALYGAALVLGLTLAALISASLMRWQQVRHLRQLHAETQRLVNETRAKFDEHMNAAAAQMDKAEDSVERSRIVLDEAERTLQMARETALEVLRARSADAT